MTFFPVLYAAIAVIAVGIVIYELVSTQEENPHGGRRKPDRSPTSISYDSLKPPRSPVNSRKPPTGSPKHTRSEPLKGSEKSDCSTVVPNPNTPVNNLRRRNFDQTSNKENSSETKDAAENASTITVKKTRKTAYPSSSENSCMLNKLTNDAKNINKNIKREKFLEHNICKEESDSSESNFIPKSEEKLINQTDKNSFCNSKKLKCKRKSKRTGLKSAQNNRDNFFVNSDQYVTKSSSDSHSDDSVTFAPTNVTKVNPIRQRYVNKNATDQGFKSQSSNLYPEIDFHLSNLGSAIDKSSSSSDEDTYKKQCHKSLKNDISGSKENLIVSSIISSPQRIKEDFHLSNLGSAVNISSSSSDENTYKKELLESFKNDIFGSEENGIDSSVISSPEIIKGEKPTYSNICLGCEERHVNTHAYPCNHAYLCVDCAVRIFRLYKKCTICLAHVEEYLQFKS